MKLENANMGISVVLISILQFIPDPETGGHQLTPLALASARGNLEIVEMLVEAKANVNYTSAVSQYRIHFRYAIT